MTDLTSAEEGQLRELVYSAFDAKGTESFPAKAQAVVDWYEGIEGRRLTLRIVAGEKFRENEERVI